MKNQSKHEWPRVEQEHKPVVGEVFNPLLQFPRNHSCFCGSGEKFKYCCEGRQPRKITREWSDRISQCWDRLLNGTLRIVPPKEAKRAEQPEDAMPEVPMVPEEDERVLAKSAEPSDTTARPT